MEKKKRNLLVVTHTAPYPPSRNGETLRVHNLLHHLHAEWAIDLICLQPCEKKYEEALSSIYHEVFLTDAAEHLQEGYEQKGYFSKIRFLFSPPQHLFSLNYPYSPAMHQLTTKIAASKKYDAILAVRAHIFGFYLNNLRNFNITCDVGDSTNLFLKSLAKTRIWGKERLSLYYAYFYNKRWEKRYLLCACKKITAITERDKNES